MFYQIITAFLVIFKARQAFKPICMHKNIVSVKFINTDS